MVIEYFDYINQETITADGTTEAFLVVNSDNTYSFRLVLEGSLQKLRCDMLNRETTYWRVQIPFHSKDLLEELFPNGKLRTTPLLATDAVRFFAIDPRITSATPFNEPVVEQNENRGFGVRGNDQALRYNPEWISINTNVLNGDIFSKRNFDSMINVSRSRYSTFFTPYTSKEDVLSELKNTALSSLKLFVYLSVSVSAIDFFCTSIICSELPYIGQGTIYVNHNLEGSIDSFSLKLKLSLYSALLDSLFTLVNPVINLLSLVARSGATIVSAASYSHEENEPYVAPIGFIAS